MSEIHTVKLDNNSVDYAVFGNGNKPFVIIPGLSIKSVLESLSSVESHYSVFKGDYKVYLLDCPEILTDKDNILSISQTLYSAIDKLGLRDLYMFGASQGGMTAQCIASQHPEIMSKLVLGSTLSEENDTVKNTISLWKELARERKTVDLYTDMFKKLYTPSVAEKAEAFAKMFSFSTTDAELDRFIIQCNACDGFDITASLDKITCPVLIIGAENDRVVTCEATEITHRIKNSRVYIYENYTHAVYDEAPDYTQRIKSFFEE